MNTKILNFLVFILITFLLINCGGGSGGQTPSPGAVVNTPEPQPDPSPSATAMPQPDPTDPPIANASRLERFEPEDGSILVFIGQDNNGVGGNRALISAQTFNNGYIDAGLPVPAGITSYIGLRDDSANPNGNVPTGFTIAGLHTTTNYGAGPVCLRCYLENSTFDIDNLIVHLSIFYADDNGHARRILNGVNDAQIAELAAFMNEFSNVAFFLRPGYEFDLQYIEAGVLPADYSAAFRRIVDGLRDAGTNNFATVFSSARVTTPENLWQASYPGDDYVDWIGYSHFGSDIPTENSGTLAFARSQDKPVMITEATPGFLSINEQSGLTVWDTYFTPLFMHFDIADDLVKAVAYINTDWRTQALFSNIDIFQNTDARIQRSSDVSQNWISELRNSRYILARDNVHERINFE